MAAPVRNILDTTSVLPVIRSLHTVRPSGIIIIVVIIINLSYNGYSPLAVLS
jgi:hypothetical protein